MLEGNACRLLLPCCKGIHLAICLAKKCTHHYLTVICIVHVDMLYFLVKFLIIMMGVIESKDCITIATQ